MIETLNSLDTSFFLFLHSLNHSGLNPVMVFLSGTLVWIPLLAYSLYLAFQQFGRRNVFIFAFFIALTIMAADTTSSQILKNFFGRLRPCKQDDILTLMNSFGQKCGGRFGFVSGHASNTFSATMFIIGSLELSRRTQVIFLCFPILVSFSRIYLGVHFPGDILGGALLGSGIGLFMAWAFKNSQGARRESSQV